MRHLDLEKRDSTPCIFKLGMIRTHIFSAWSFWLRD